MRAIAGKKQGPAARPLNLANTKLINVLKSFDLIPATGRGTKFAGNVADDGGLNTHLQGIAAFKDFHFLTQSDETKQSGRILVADRRPDHKVLLREMELPVVSAKPPFYFHAGGCQLLGDCLAAPCETRQNKSIVMFLDVSRAPDVQEIAVSLRITRYVRDAAAAGTTTVSRDGQEIALVAVYDSGTVDFYESRDLAGGVAFVPFFSTKIEEKNHQSTILLTDVANRVFLAGINQTFIGKNTVLLYEVDFAARSLALVRTRSFSPKGGASLRWGASLEIVSESRLVLQCTGKHYHKGCNINAFDIGKERQRLQAPVRRQAKASRYRGIQADIHSRPAQ